MTARMKAPTHCEICGESSKYMTNSQRPDDLIDYGVCMSCMKRLGEKQLEAVEVAYDELEELVYSYPPLEEEFRNLLRGLSQLVRVQ